MPKIGTMITVAAARTGPAAALPARRSSTPTLPANCDANGLPVRLDRECDIELPRQLFAGWERDKVEARAAALEDALKPFAATDQHAVRASINGLFSGYRSMRQQGDDARAIVDVTMAVLREFPAWAIAQACRKIICGQTKLDRRFPPNDTELFDIVADVVRLYGENLMQAKALLDAPVEEPRFRGPSGPFASIGPRPEKARQRPEVESMTKSRREALMADLAARKARNDARLDVCADPAEERRRD